MKKRLVTFAVAALLNSGAVSATEKGWRISPPVQFLLDHNTADATVSFGTSELGVSCKVQPPEFALHFAMPLGKFDKISGVADLRFRSDNREPITLRVERERGSLSPDTLLFFSASPAAALHAAEWLRATKTSLELTIIDGGEVHYQTAVPVHGIERMIGFVVSRCK